MFKYIALFIILHLIIQQTVHAQQSSTVYHLINVEINRYNYLIDLTLKSSEDYINSLEEVSRSKVMVDRPDYRKNQQNVFGIVQFQGRQILDQRVQFKRRMLYNLYYYFRDFYHKITWISLNHINQVGSSDIIEQIREGAFNFGPRNSESQILKDLKKYSKFMQKTMITFKGNKKNKNGEVIFGQFPSKYLLNQNIQTASLQYLSQQNWIITTSGLQLHKTSGNSVTKTDLYKQMVKVKLSISSRTVIIPSTSGQTLKRSIPKCTYTTLPDSDDTKNYLACKDMTENQLNSLSLKFILKDCELPLSILLKHQIITNIQNTYWFDVIVGEQNEYQIGESILREYMIGIDYKQGRFMFGMVVQESWMTKELFIEMFVIINIVVFLVAFIIVLMEKKVKEIMKIAIKQQFGLPQKEKPSQVNSYQLASVSEEVLSQ